MTPERTIRTNPPDRVSVAETVTREELAARLDWGDDFFKNESYPVVELPAIDLLHPSRFDLLAKSIFADYLVRGVRSDFGERVYAEHIRVWNGFYEAIPAKRTKRDFVEAFRDLVAVVSREGLGRSRSLIPVDRFGRIIDGAHRVAAGIAVGSTVRVVQTETAARDRFVPDYDYQFFAQSRAHVASGLGEYYSDEMARVFCRLRPDSRIVVLFPVGARECDAEALGMLADVGTVVYARSFLLNERGSFQFIRHLYQHDPRGWMGTRQTGFAGARDKAKRCFTAFAPCRIVLLDPATGIDFAEFKQRLRALYGQHDAVHISDTAEELPLVSGFAFNRNSIDFFNRARTRTFERFESLFARFADALSTSNISREDATVHGSACMAAAGLRDARDIDFLGFNSLGEHIATEGICRRPIDAVVSREYADSVIFDPANHFWYFGQKFATLQVVRDYKLRRAEVDKDPHDIALIDRILRPTRWDKAVTSYFSMVGLQRRSARDAVRSALDRVGLLSHLRRLRR